MPRTLVAVFAHPDDAYGIAGTVALHADDPEFRFVLVLATDGGAGDIRDGFPATRETLGAVRRGEDEAAWRALGRVPDRHEWLGYQDGAVSDVPPEELTERVAAILAEERPDVVATFGPDGIFGHPDHIAIGAATPRFTGSRRTPTAAFGGCVTARSPSPSSSGGTHSARRWDCTSSTRRGPTTCAACRTRGSASP